MGVIKVEVNATVILSLKAFHHFLTGKNSRSTKISRGLQSKILFYYAVQTIVNENVSPILFAVANIIGLNIKVNYIERVQFFKPFLEVILKQ
jgi:hypothetical protein